MDKPTDYVEIQLECALVCTVGDRQSIIMFEPVGDTTKYTVQAGFKDYTRHPSVEAPTLSRPLYTSEFFGAALKRARAWCGWEWEPHPDKHEDMP